MWISRGKYFGQKGQKVQGPCGRSVSGLFQKCQGDSGRHYKPWKWKILERCLNIVSPTNAIIYFFRVAVVIIINFFSFLFPHFRSLSRMVRRAEMMSSQVLFWWWLGQGQGEVKREIQSLPARVLVWLLLSPHSLLTPGEVACYRAPSISWTRWAGTGRPAWNRRLLLLLPTWWSLNVLTLSKSIYFFCGIFISHDLVWNLKTSHFIGICRGWVRNRNGGKPQKTFQTSIHVSVHFWNPQILECQCWEGSQLPGRRPSVHSAGIDEPPAHHLTLWGQQARARRPSASCGSQTFTTELLSDFQQGTLPLWFSISPAKWPSYCLIMKFPKFDTGCIGFS